MYLMTPDEAAKKLKVANGTLRRWLQRGELKAAKTPAGWRISDDDIARYLARHHTGTDVDDDADLIAEAEAVLDRIARGEEHTVTLDEWEQRCDALDR